MSALCGVDGCPAGWIAVWRADANAAPQIIVRAAFAQLVSALPAGAVFAVDMPIGLPERIEGGGRGPEKAVRPSLGPRQSSVFSVPSRQAVYAETGPAIGQADIIAAHKRASLVALETSNPARKISIQAFMLFPKIRELDQVLRQEPRLQHCIFESHPEFAFAILNGAVPMSLPKKIKGKVNPEGMAERRALLARHALDQDFLAQPAPKGAASDDFLDACAMLLIAGRIAGGVARPHPSPLQRDSCGLPMAIWA